MNLKLFWIVFISIIFSIIILFIIIDFQKVEYDKNSHLPNPKTLTSFVNIDGKKIIVKWAGIEKKPSPINYSLPLKPSHIIEDSPSKINNFREIKYTINSKGFRDKNYSYVKPNGTYRIILIGDSYVFGGSVNDNETFDYFMEKKLNEMPLPKIEVLNLGVWGFNTKHEVQRLKELGSKFSPDLVLMFYFQNDLENEEMADKMMYYFTHALERLNISSEKAFLAYKNMLKTQYQTTPLNVPSEQGFQEVNNSLKELNNLHKKYNFSLILFAFPSPLNQITNLKKVAKKYQWPFFNLEKMGYDYKNPWIVSKYDKHPSVYAHKKIADFLIKYLICTYRKDVFKDIPCKNETNY